MTILVSNPLRLATNLDEVRELAIELCSGFQTL